MKPQAKALLEVLLRHHSQTCTGSLVPPREACLITYGDLCERAGMQGQTRVVGPLLREIAEWCSTRGYPPINALVVNRETRIPGDNYDQAPGCHLLNWPQDVDACIAFRSYPRRSEDAEVTAPLESRNTSGGPEAAGDSAPAVDMPPMPEVVREPMASWRTSKPAVELLHEIKARLQSEFGPRLKDVFIYGSRARGDHRPDSDLDVMVLLEGPLSLMRDIEKSVNALYPLQLQLDYPIHANPVDAHEYEAQEYALYHEVKREGIRL